MGANAAALGSRAATAIETVMESATGYHLQRRQCTRKQALGGAYRQKSVNFRHRSVAVSEACAIRSSGPYPRAGIARGMRQGEVPCREALASAELPVT